MKKRTIALILCLLMLVPCFLFGVSAEGATEEPFVDISKESMLKASSQWNYYSAPKYTIDGDLNAVAAGGWAYWRPNAPGRDPSVNLSDTWIEYRYKEYKEIDTITMYARKYTSNMKFRLQVLIMGEWHEFPALNMNTAPIYKYTYDGKEYNGDTIMLVWDTDVIIEQYNAAHPDNPIEPGNLNTKKFRVYFDYADQWNPPIIYETVIMGRTGKVPEFEVPDDAELSTNAALSGHMYASSATLGRYPALGADNSIASSWQSDNKTDGEWVKAEFDKPYDITNLSLNFGGIVDTYSFTVDVSLLYDDAWEFYETVDVTTSSDYEDALIDIFNGNDDNALKNVRGVKVVFSELNGKPAVISEINAKIANGGKCIFLAGWMTNDRKSSVANGNIAIYGKAYASATFDYLGISDVSFINDGQILDPSPCWYAGDMGTGNYCGVTLGLDEGEKATISKIVLNFNDYITWDYYNMITQVRENKVKDDYILGFELQAKQADGTFKTIATGSSYDSISKSYIVSFDFTDLVTDDVRVVFTSTDAGYAYLKEIEIFSSDVEYGDEAINGYSSFAHDRKKPKASTTFATPHIVFRAAFMDIISPLSSAK